MSGTPIVTQEMPDAQPFDARMPRRRLVFLLPVILFAGLAATLAWGLGRDPQQIPSALIGRPVPEFALPPVQGRSLGLSSRDLSGEVSLVNVFASWCTACRYEHPLFMRLQAEGTVLIHGLNYKDKPADVAQWLDTLGDPYTRTGADLDGRVAIDWGVYGVPETFVVSADGRIVHKHIGPLTQKDLDETILPMVEALRRGATSSTALSGPALESAQ
ncbi:MAG: thiol:disulfide interchange protein [Alphaproteobacteria bacterium]|jgi:cytochrome c biogenesis protein CcmG/thiol:disulfide interchange protein DsbE|nr:MAG: thiol:disulfide interchange protein [Alphaproteobacteria bacterium]